MIVAGVASVAVLAVAQDGESRAAFVIPQQAAPSAVLKVQELRWAPEGVPGAVADGQVAPAIVVNGSVPGTELRFREGDAFRVLVENHLTDAPTSIHWHGMLVPSGMDGVPGITTLPIVPRRAMLYEFPLRQTGTYWYHSHQGFQEQQGLFGALIIEEADDPVGADHDPVILLSDWTHKDPNAVFAALRSGGGGAGGESARPEAPTAPMAPVDHGHPTHAGKGSDGGSGSMAGAGGGRGMAAMSGADLSDVKYDAFLLNGRASAAPWTFEARPGERVRLRVINGGASTVFKVALDGHPLTVTHADGLAVEPVEVDWILMGMGETYDMLVTLKDSGSFTLHAVAQDGSGQAVGVLHTPGTSAMPNRSLPEFGPRKLEYTQLRAPGATVLPEGPLREFRLPLRGDMSKYVWTVGDAPFPETEPLLIRRGDRVRMEIVNETAMWHPMHLHGHFFRLLNGAGDRAPLKHTVNVAPGETVTIEFFADNPGTWFFHCHNLYHLEGGMARLVEYEP